MTSPPPAHDKLQNPEAFLSRRDLRGLGLERRAIDAIYQRCNVIFIPGYSLGLIKVRDFQNLIEKSTFKDDRVRAPKSQ